MSRVKLQLAQKYSTEVSLLDLLYDLGFEMNAQLLALRDPTASFIETSTEFHKYLTECIEFESPLDHSYVVASLSKLVNVSKLFEIAVMYVKS